MSIYPSWKNIYAAGPYVTWPDNNTAAPVDNYHTDGVQALWKNTPNFAIAPETIERETATGKPYRHSQDYLAGTKSTSLSLEFDHAIEESKFYLASLFQKIMTVSSEDDESKYITFLPYSATPDFLNDYGKQLFLTEKHGDVATDGSTLYNAVVQSMNFTAASNEALSVTAEVLGRNVINGTTDAHSALSAAEFAALSPASQSPLLWQDATVLVGRPAVLDIDDAGWDTPAYTIGIKDSQAGAATALKIDIESVANGIAVGDYFTVNTFVIDSGTTAKEKAFAITVSAVNYTVTPDIGVYNEVTLALELEKQFALNSDTNGYDIRVVYDPQNHKFGLVSDTTGITIPATLTDYQLCIHMGFAASDAALSFTAESGDTNYFLEAANDCRAGGSNGIYKVTALDGTVVTFTPAMVTSLSTIADGNEPYRSITMYSRVKSGNFSLNLSNNATVQFFDEQTIEAIALGRLTGDGSFNQLFGTRDAWDALTDVADSVTRPVIVFWGDGAPETDPSAVTGSIDNFHIYLSAKMIGREPEDDNVLMDTVSFSIVNHVFSDDASSINYRLVPIYITVNTGSILWDYNAGVQNEDFWNPSVKQRIAF